MKQRTYASAETSELLELVNKMTTNHPWEKFIQKNIKRTLKKLDKNKNDLQDLLNLIIAENDNIKVVTAIYMQEPTEVPPHDKH